MLTDGVHTFPEHWGLEGFLGFIFQSKTSQQHAKSKTEQWGGGGTGKKKYGKGSRGRVSSSSLNTLMIFAGCTISANASHRQVHALH